MPLLVAKYTLYIIQCHMLSVAFVRLPQFNVIHSQEILLSNGPESPWQKNATEPQNKVQLICLRHLI